MEEKKTIKNVSRRGFITKSTLAAFGSLLGAKMVFGENFPKDIEPVGLQEASKNTIERKHKDLIVLNDKPINAETPAHLLDPEVTPADVFFVRNNGVVPQNIDVNSWKLTIDGESVKAPRTYTIAELKSKFKS